MKPTIFFSHSSKDARPLSLIKSRIIEITGNTVDIFLSSDGQSIPLGRNWVHRIQEGLTNARIMIVFISPESINSDWVYFEAGFAYARELKVIPVGINGVDLSILRPPISLLQGFNISSEDGLNNIIAVINNNFDMRHRESFTSDDFGMIFPSNSPDGRSKIFASSLIEEIRIEIEQEELEVHSLAASNTIESILKNSSLEYKMSFNGSSDISLHTFGFHAQCASRSGRGDFIRLYISPGSLGDSLEVASQIAESTRVDGIKNLAVEVVFKQGVNAIASEHQVSGRLFNSGVGIGSDNHFELDGIRFNVELRYNRNSDQYIVYLYLLLGDHFVSETYLGKLIDLLLDREVISIS